MAENDGHDCGHTCCQYPNNPHHEHECTPAECSVCVQRAADYAALEARADDLERRVGADRAGGAERDELVTIVARAICACDEDPDADGGSTDVLACWIADALVADRMERRPASSGDGGAPTDEEDADEAAWVEREGYCDPCGTTGHTFRTCTRLAPVSEEGPPEFDGLALVEAVERAARFAMKDTALGSPALVKLVAGFIGEEVQEMLRHRIVLPQPPAGDGPLCWLPEGRWVRGMSPKEWIDATPEPPETPTPLWVLPGSTRPAATPEQGEGPAK